MIPITVTPKGKSLATLKLVRKAIERLNRIQDHRPRQSAPVKSRTGLSKPTRDSIKALMDHESAAQSGA